MNSATWHESVKSEFLDTLPDLKPRSNYSAAGHQAVRTPAEAAAVPCSPAPAAPSALPPWGDSRPGAVLRCRQASCPWTFSASRDELFTCNPRPKDDPAGGAGGTTGRRPAFPAGAQGCLAHRDTAPWALEVRAPAVRGGTGEPGAYNIIASGGRDVPGAE